MAYVTETLPFDERSIEKAADIVGRGDVVAIASETVYGLAGDATNAGAVARIYAAKGRPAFNPLIVHVNNTADAQSIAHFTPQALRLAERFWPGPLTLVLPVRGEACIPKITTAGLATIAVRVPAHPAIRSLIQACDRPLAAPSANASGQISPTRASHVLASLGGRISLIIDAGPTPHGVESTVLSVRDQAIRMLRPGPIDLELIEAVTGLTITTTGHSDRIESPGQISSHYAPSKPLRLDAYAAQENEWLIGFGAVHGDDCLSSAGDLIEAAANLFDALHRADSAKARSIAVAPIPISGLGLAINDRLNRAAAPRA